MTESYYGDGTKYRGLQSKDSGIKTKEVRKPLDVDQILDAFEAEGFDPGHNRLRCFFEGIRFAEEHHGIAPVDLTESKPQEDPEPVREVLHTLLGVESHKQT